MKDMTKRVTLRIPADLSDIFPDFLENRRKEIAQIPSALQICNYQQIRIWGHNMAGCGEGYGFPEISEIGRCLEAAALGHNAEAVGLYSEKLTQLVSDVEIIYC